MHTSYADGPPMRTSYADGTPIPDATIAAIRAAYWHHSVAVALETDDLVIVDNMLASHGRMSWLPPAPRAAHTLSLSEAERPLRYMT